MDGDSSRIRPLIVAACLVSGVWTRPAVAQDYSIDNAIRMIHVGASPQSAVISKDGRYLYVGNFGANDVSVIDITTNEVSNIVVGEAPHGLLLSHDGRRLYVLTGGDDPDAALVVINTTGLSTLRRISVPRRTDALALTPDDKRLYLARVYFGVSYLDIDSMELAPESVIHDTCPIGIAISKDGTRMFVNYQCYGPGGSASHPAHDAIVEYDLPTFRRRTQRNDLANVGDQLVVSPDGTELWANGADACSRPDYPHDGCPSVPSRIVNVLRISEDPGKDFKLLKSYDFSMADSNGRISISPSGTAFVGGGIDLKQIDTHKLDSIHRITIGSVGDVVFSPDGDTAYVVVSDKNEVDVLRRGQLGDHQLRDAAAALSPKAVTDILLKVSCPDGNGLTRAIGCSTPKGAYVVPPEVSSAALATRGIEAVPGRVEKSVDGEDAGCFMAQHLRDMGADPQQLITWASTKRDHDFIAYAGTQNASSAGGETLIDVTGHLGSFNALATGLEYGAVYLGVIVCPHQVATVLFRETINGPVIKIEAGADAQGRSVSRDALRKLVNRLLADLKNPCSDHPEEVAEKLYHILIPKELEAELRTAQNEFDSTGANKLTLAWELGDALRYVPMDALFDGNNYLVKSYSSAILTGTSFSIDKQNAPFVAVAAGDSLGDNHLPGGWVADPLPNVVDELRSIFYSKSTKPLHVGQIPAAILLDDAPPPDEKFTTENLQRALDDLGRDPHTRQQTQRPIIHIASHFLLNDTAATSFLLTRSGLLSLSALSERDRFPFTSTWLVTFSACETAAIRSSTNLGGKGQQPLDGHEVEGLGYVANAHGAHAVLASLWEVDDSSTRMLMNDFYTGVIHSKAKAESLRNAEENILDYRGRGKRGLPFLQSCRSENNGRSPYSHPHYWAPFILIGNWH